MVDTRRYHGTTKTMCICREDSMSLTNMKDNVLGAQYAYLCETCEYLFGSPSNGAFSHAAFGIKLSLNRNIGLPRRTETDENWFVSHSLIRGVSLSRKHTDARISKQHVLL